MSDKLYIKNNDNVNGNSTTYKSYFRDYTGESNNVRIDNGNGNVPYGRFKVEERVFRYCWYEGKELPEGSVEPFCDFGCKQAYYAEIRKETDAVWGEISGRD